MKIIGREIKSRKWDKETLFRFLAIIGGVLFFAHELNIAIFVRIFTLFKIENSIAVTITSFIPIILSVPLLTKRYRKLKIFYIIYLAIFLYFLVSILLNLESLEYYIRPKYGIHRVFFPSGGIFSIYYILLLYDKDNKSDILVLFILSALAIFAIGSLQFIAAKYRGYWVFENMKGNIGKLSYSLDFGFGMAFAINLFLGMAFIRNKNSYMALALMGYYMIITDGNRMSIVLPVAVTLLFIIYFSVNGFINKLDLKKDLIKAVLILMSLIIVFAMTFIFRQLGITWIPALAIILTLFLLFFAVVRIVEKFNSKKNIVKSIVVITLLAVVVSSVFLLKQKQASNNEKRNNLKTKTRTIEMLSSGNIFYDNARKEIHGLVWSGLKNHPIIGLGAFGDRPLVAPKYIWGHSHGIHMELWSNLGLLFGLPFIIYLVNTFFVILFKNKNFDTIMYFVFVGTASLHLTSLSFWIEYYIWGLIAFSILSMNRNDYWIAKIFGNKVKE
ncbi:MAG: hypothetical protein Q4A42_05900 [Tissierellia bacterium]|nr:hypothetical protein [Tissierellia bacterium]